MPPSSRYVIREVEPQDLDGLLRLAKHLNSVNFPHDREILERTLAASRRSFEDETTAVADGRYMFVLEPEDGGDFAGVSMIFGQHGTPNEPHVYFDVLEDERYSTTLDRHFRHITLRLGFAYQGPSEIGALILDPAYRSGGLGKPLSFVRFLFMAMYRHRFRDEVIAELMPPLESDGRSRLWEHIGRRFTGLSYQEADKLSHSNKEFIISLFPMSMNATLLPHDVRALIGEVGDQTRGVRRMLESIGFKYAQRIDPFDGGPHFHAVTDEVTVIKRTSRAVVTSVNLPPEDERAALDKRSEATDAVRALIAVGRPKGPTRFRAMAAAVRRSAWGVDLTAVHTAACWAPLPAPRWPSARTEGAQ